MGEALYNSERNFRRFEALIQRIVLNYPQPFVFRANGLRPETAANRLRDAVRFQLKNKWATYIDMLKLAEVHSKVSYIHDGHKVTVAIKGQKEVTPIQYTTEGVHDSPVIPEPTLEEILAFGLLITNRRLKLQIIFVGVDNLVGLAAKEYFESNPLIEFFQESPGSEEWIMI